MHRFNSFQYRW